MKSVPWLSKTALADLKQFSIVCERVNLFAVILFQDSTSYIPDLVRPVLACFNDADSRVRYYACEALYNVVKVARGAVLEYFNDIFDGLSKVG